MSFNITKSSLLRKSSWRSVGWWVLMNVRVQSRRTVQTFWNAHRSNVVLTQPRIQHRMHVHSGTALGTRHNSFRTHMPKSELTLKSNQLPSPAISDICLVAPQQQLCVCLCIWLRNCLSNSIRLDEKCFNMLCYKQFTVVFDIELHVLI